MKSAESKSSSSAAAAAKQASVPFFHAEKQAGAAFFGGERAAEPPFFSPRTIQPKLKIGAPNDMYEQQADAVADQVVAQLNSPKPDAPPAPKAAPPPVAAPAAGSDASKTAAAAPSAPAVQAKCAGCEKEEKLQKKEEIGADAGEQLQRKPIFDSLGDPPDDGVQRKCAGCGCDLHEPAIQKAGDGSAPAPASGEASASGDLSGQLSASKGGGSRLDDSTRSNMESAMGADFSNVRVHTGSDAAKMSQGIQAHAFTHGSDVYFNEGKYNPGSTDGTRLLAHELTHTVQQGTGVRMKIKNDVGTDEPQKKQIPNKTISQDEHIETSDNKVEKKAVASDKINSDRDKPHNHSSQKDSKLKTHNTTSRSSKKNILIEKKKTVQRPEKKKKSTKGLNQTSSSGKISTIDRNKFGTLKLKLSPSDFQMTPNLGMSGKYALGTKVVLDQIRNKYNAYRELFINRVALKTQSIQSVVQLQQQELIAYGIFQENQIRNIFSQERTKITSQVANAKSQIFDHANSLNNLLTESQNYGLDNLSNVFSAGQEQAVILSNTYAERSLLAADDSANLLRINVQNTTNESTEIGNQKARVSDPDTKVAKAKSETAQKITSDTTSKTTEGLDEAMNGLRATGPETANEFRKQGNEASTQLMEGKSQADNHLIELFSNASIGVGMMSNSHSNSLEGIESQLLEQLMLIENRLVNNLKQHIEQKLSDFTHAGEQSMLVFRQQGEQALRAGDNQIGTINQHIEGAKIKEEYAASVIEILDNVLSNGFNALNQSLNNSTEITGATLTQKGIETKTSIETTSSLISSQINPFSNNVTNHILHIRQQSFNQLTQLGSQTIAGSTSITSQVSAGINKQIKSIDQNFQQGFDGYNAGLLNQVNQGAAKAKEPVGTLSTRIDQGQARAAERARKSWIENQIADAIEMLSDPGFWVGLLVGLVLTAIFIALIIGTALTGGALLAVLIVGFAVIGAIAGAIGSIVSQTTNSSFTDGWDFSRIKWDQVGKAALLGAATGAVFALIGFFAVEVLGVAAGGWAFVGIMSLAAGLITIVTNIITKQPWDKGLLANMLLAGIFARVAKYLGGRNNKPVPPVVTPVDPAPPVVTPVDPAPPVVTPADPAPPEPVKPVPPALVDEGHLYELQIQDEFKNKIINKNEVIRENGIVTGEIDFETNEAVCEVGLSLEGKLPQLQRLAEIAVERGKRLDVIYDPERTPPGRLNAFKKSLRLRFGNRVRFISRSFLRD